MKNKNGSVLVWFLSTILLLIIVVGFFIFAKPSKDNTNSLIETCGNIQDNYCGGTEQCINGKCVIKNNLNVVLILLKFQDMEGNPPPLQEMKDHYVRNMIEFWREDSYSNLELSVDVYGWFIIPKNFNVSSHLIGNVEILEENNIDVELSSYDVAGYIYYEDSAGGGEGGVSAPGYVSSFLVGFDDITLSEKFKSLDWNLLDQFINHELGHVLLFGHSQAFICSSDNCNFDSYGNRYSIMGSGGTPYSIGSSEGIEYFDTATHTLASDKYNAGWLKEEEILQISNSGKYIIGPLHGGGNGFRVAHFVIQRKDYFIERRTSIGFDKGLSDTIIRNDKGGLILYSLSDRNGKLDGLIESTTMVDLNLENIAQFELEEGKEFVGEGFSLEVVKVAENEVEFIFEFL